MKKIKYIILSLLIYGCTNNNESQLDNYSITYSDMTDMFTFHYKQEGVFPNYVVFGFFENDEYFVLNTDTLSTIERHKSASYNNPNSIFLVVSKKCIVDGYGKTPMTDCIKYRATQESDIIRFLDLDAIKWTMCKYPPKKAGDYKTR